MENKNIPENANDHCPGVDSKDAGLKDSCKGCPNKKICKEPKEENIKQKQTVQNLLNQKLAKIKHKILVLSGKGGVGKSTISTQLSFALASKGYEVGLLDLDLCGPSIPRTTGLEGQEVHKSQDGWSPVYIEDNLGVMSIGFMLPDQDAPVIWRGPKKNGLIQQFVMDVDWGDLDFLIVDTPPGTSDEHISIVQYLQMDQKKDGAILVSTPHKLSINDVRKEINFCKKTNVQVIGVVENMKNIICKNCGTLNQLFGGKQDYFSEMLKEFEIDKIGEQDFCEELLVLTDNGKSIYDEELSKQLKNIKKIQQNFDLICKNLIAKIEFKSDQLIQMRFIKLVKWNKVLQLVCLCLVSSCLMFILTLRFVQFLPLILYNFFPTLRIKLNQILKKFDLCFSII